MKANLLFKSGIVIFTLLKCTIAFSQNKAPFTSEINKVGQPGFYKIVLTPEIISRASRALSDLRIFNEKNEQVPYLLRSDVPVFKENNFREMKVLSSTREEDKLTHVVLENQSGRMISDLFVVVRNNDVSRTVTVSGSDDRKNWYVIKEDLFLSNVGSLDADRYIQLLSFPKSSYRYFEIIINGKNLLPINIVKAGTYEDVYKSGKFIRNPSPVFNQKDSGRFSYLYTRFREAYRTDEIELLISGPKYYQRNFTVIEKESGKEMFRQTFTLRSGAGSRFSTNLKTAELEIVIENEDSPPLRIDSIRSFQLNRYLLAFLDSSHHYHLAFGDGSLAAPRYDIGYFKDSLQHTVGDAATGPIKVNQPDVIAKQHSAIGKPQLWVVIGAVLAVLLFLTFRMAREVNKAG